MELSHSNRIFFDETSHSYLLDDEVLLMGVTELMRKHNLGADYSGIPEAVLKKAAAAGTELHREIQDYENGETVFATELIDEYKKLGLKFVESEYPVSDYSLIASAIDAVYEGSKPDTVILVDFKATEKLHRRALAWQLGIYKVLFEAQNPGIKVEGLYCLHLDKKSRRIRGFFPIEGVSHDEVDALLNAERDGLIYIDENAIPDCTDIITQEEADTLVANATKIAELKATLKVLEDANEAINAKLLSYMEGNKLTDLAAPGGVFKRKAGSTQTRVDTKALQDKYPAVYAKVVKTVSVKGSVSFKPNK